MSSLVRCLIKAVPEIPFKEHWILSSIDFGGFEPNYPAQRRKELKRWRRNNVKFRSSSTSCDEWMKRRKYKKATSLLMLDSQKFSIIEQLKESYTVRHLWQVFGVHRS